MSLCKINGRTRYFSRVQEVRKLRPGHYVVVACFGVFHVEGGRPAGGTSRDWFLEQANGTSIYTRAIPCTSLMDALHIIENT